MGTLAQQGELSKIGMGGLKHNLEHRESKHTALSAKYWQLLDDGLNPKVSWEIKAHATTLPSRDDKGLGLRSLSY